MSKQTLKLSHPPIECDPEEDRREAEFMNWRAVRDGRLLDPAELRVDWEGVRTQQATDEAEYEERMAGRRWDFVKAVCRG